MTPSSTRSNQPQVWSTPQEEIPKPGIRSTEMWGKVVVQLILVANAAFGLGIEISDETALAIAAGLEAVYAVSRSITKRTASCQIEAHQTAQQTAQQTDKMVAAVSAAIRYQAQYQQPPQPLQSATAAYTPQPQPPTT